MKGFFSKSEWAKQKVPLSLIPECGKCGIWESCKSPKMPVNGKGRKKVLIIGEAPGENEDNKGIPFCGEAGMLLMQMLANIGISMRTDCWITNALICRPHTENTNRTPTALEVGYCRANLAKTLFALKPDVIIPLGKWAVTSLLPLVWKGKNESTEMGRWAGWTIPCERLNAWVCPTYHPSYLKRTKSPGLELITRRHLEAAFKLVGTRPWDEKNDWPSLIRPVKPDDVPDYIGRFVKQGNPIAFDYETNMLKPDSPKAEILCCSVSDGVTTIAYPWSSDAIPATSWLLKSTVPKIAANLRFEERWTRRMLKHGVNNWLWDTLLGAHWLNCKHGICGLKFQAFVLLGTDDYDSHLDSLKESKNSNTPNRLKEVELDTLLLYCGLDSLFEVLVANKQMENLDA